MDTLPPDFELPPGEATLRCPCGFESKPFCFIEHLYRCQACRTVDIPLRVPFLYVPPKCSVCSRQFERGDRIHANRMRPRWVLSEESAFRQGDVALCPTCGSNSLAVNSLGVDYEVLESDHVDPWPGDRMHARTMKSDREDIGFFLWSPRLSRDISLSCEVQNRAPEEIEDGHHEFRVVSVNDSRPKLILQYVRRLPASEWEWYY
jgi:hypothetical protein